MHLSRACVATCTRNVLGTSQGCCYDRVFFDANGAFDGTSTFPTFQQGISQAAFKCKCLVVPLLRHFWHLHRLCQYRMGRMNVWKARCIEDARQGTVPAHLGFGPVCQNKRKASQTGAGGTKILRTNRSAHVLPLMGLMEQPHGL